MESITNNISKVTENIFNNIDKAVSYMTEQLKNSEIIQNHENDNVDKIYVLKCGDDKYYVGKTRTTIEKRLEWHFSENNNCEFTKKYKPIQLVEIFKSNSIFDEDNITKKYMMNFGINNVRGGSYCQLNLQQYQIMALNNEFISMKDQCFNCHQYGHYAKDCPNKKIVSTMEKIISSNIHDTNTDHQFSSKIDDYLSKFNTIKDIDDEICNLKLRYIKIKLLKEHLRITDRVKIDIFEDVLKYRKYNDIKKQKSISDHVNDEHSKLSMKLTDLLIILPKICKRCFEKEFDVSMIDIIVLETINFNIDTKTELEKINDEGINDKLVGLLMKRIALLSK